MPKQPLRTDARDGLEGRAVLQPRDAALFILGTLAGALGLFLGGPIAMSAPSAVALIAGIVDGRASPAIRPFGSWSPAWLGSLVVPVYAVTSDALRDPPAPDGGLALSVGLAFLGVGSLIFVALAVTASIIVRAVRTRRSAASRGKLSA